MQMLARDHSHGILEESEKLRLELDVRIKQLDVERQKLELAAMEQKKADESVLRLVEEQKKEKAQLDAKQKLELEILLLKGTLQVMKHMGGDEDSTVKEKMENMSEKLKDKIEEMEDLEALNQTLVVKEHKSNNELQYARKELIMVKEMEDMSEEVKDKIKEMEEFERQKKWKMNLKAAITKKFFIFSVDQQAPRKDLVLDSC